MDGLSGWSEWTKSRRAACVLALKTVVILSDYKNRQHVAENI
jgi:hypothetical protein